MSAVDSQPADNEETKRKWSLGFVVCACVVVLALYALSPLPVFFGDDQTDEEGFAVVQNAGGLAVFVGPARESTLALHRLDTPAEVGQVLALLAQLA